jgi:Glucanosyltransferase
MVFHQNSRNNSTCCSSMTQNDDSRRKQQQQQQLGQHTVLVESIVPTTSSMDVMADKTYNNMISNVNENVSYREEEERRKSTVWLGYGRATVMLLSVVTKTLQRIKSTPVLVLLLLSIMQLNSIVAQDTYPSTCSQYAMPLQLKGKKFFKAIDGSYIPLKGINYYPRPNVGNYTSTNSMDFYTDEFQWIWERDIAYFTKLNINAVRIYAVDPSKNHDAFMCALKQYGIYVIIGLAADCLDCAVTGDSAPTCYPQKLLERGEYIVQQFSRYTNVIGFDAGNEISLRVENEVTNGPCQKQFLRDMRNYVKNCVSSNMMRHIPIGLAVADIQRSYKALYYKYVYRIVIWFFLMDYGMFISNDFFV